MSTGTGLPVKRREVDGKRDRTPVRGHVPATSGTVLNPVLQHAPPCVHVLLYPLDGF